MKNMNELKLFFVSFAIHKDKEWICNAGYIFAKKPESVSKLLAKKFGEVRMLALRKIDVEEGTVLYGERWYNL